MKTQRIVAGWLLVQGFTVASWWVVLLIYPELRNLFRPVSWPDHALMSFWLADVVLITFGSALAAIAIMNGNAWASVAVWAVAVAAWYPTLYCIAVSWMTGEAWLASALMSCMAGLSLVAATMIGIGTQRSAVIRETPMKQSAAIAWTMLQIIIFWSVFLWILPMGIVEVEKIFEWPQFSHPRQMLLALTLFAAASALGLASGISMARVGFGTPLPTAAAPKLVASGPYRFVRNPMAVAGIAQGLAVGWLLGSFSVLAYSILGGLVWHCLARPIEEADLIDRFGEPYLQYRHKVGLWLPRSTEGTREIRRTK